MFDCPIKYARFAIVRGRYNFSYIYNDWLPIMSMYGLSALEIISSQKHQMSIEQELHHISIQNATFVDIFIFCGSLSISFPVLLRL